MDAHRVAFNTWQEKTEWVQKDKRFDVLLPWGKHRADVMKEYIDHLEAKCAALAAENAGLKSVCEDRRAFIMNGVQLGYIQVPTVETDPALETIRVAVAPQEPTPATDDFLAEVRAQGVEMFALMFAEEAIKTNNITTGWRAKASRAASEYAEALREDAAQLRKGVQS